MEFIKDKTSIVLNPIINKATDVALELIDGITNAGFEDYSVPMEIKKYTKPAKTKDEVMKSLQDNPTNIKMHEQLAAMSRENFEIKLTKIHEEIIEMLLK